MTDHAYHASTDRSPEAVFDYMADLRNAATWLGLDPAIDRVDGTAGEVGATYEVVLAQPIVADITLTYELVEVQRPELLVWRVTHRTLSEATDTYRIAARAGGGTDLEYNTHFAYTGLTKLAQPLATLITKAMDAGLTKRLEAELAKL